MIDTEVKEKGLVNTLISGLVKIENYCLILFIVSMVVVCFLQVLFRYVFSISAPWTEELGKFLMIWLIFIGAGWAVHAEDHIKVDVLDLVIKNKRILRAIDVLTALIITVFSFFFLYSSIIYLPQVISSNSQTISLGIPMWIPQSCLVIGALLIALHSVELLIRKVVNFVKGLR